jgi:E3 ubiquitin-protein ligase BRE1
MKAEAEAREQLAAATKQLELFQSVYGDPSALAPDVQTLSDQLQKKDNEVRRLRMLDAQRTQVNSRGILPTLCSFIDVSCVCE